ncbi:hypothetical protein CYMTET_7423 [Cymbomonas tetramitiformis]|uniref:Uncharacterized protein n=1 Tax=Cymbomonas tetramitiformis TaxID=36881 RepID=A0AAE0GV12_9CHLO|nr:hypothetical protein CYMTET_7423 [Cymbomonas tetramitiformis]
MGAFMWTITTVAAVTFSQVESRYLLCRENCEVKFAQRLGHSAGHHPPPTPALPGTVYSKDTLQEILKEKLDLRSLANSWIQSGFAPPGVEAEKIKLEGAVTSLQAELGAHTDISQEVITRRPSENPVNTAYEPVSRGTDVGLSMQTMLLPLLLGCASGGVVSHLYRGRFASM